jgi:hypothetical protein
VDVAFLAVVADYTYRCFYCDIFLTALNIKFGYDAVYFGKRVYYIPIELRRFTKHIAVILAPTL